MALGEPRADPGGLAPRSGVLRWSGAELDLCSAEVRRDGTVLRLDRSSYEVLLALVLRAGRVLSKDELLDAAWPGRVVSENSLAKAISRLRRELGEGAAAPLQSVHGYGYRWTGEVQWLDADSAVIENLSEGAASLDRWLGLPVPARPGWTFRRVLDADPCCPTLLAESEQGDPPRVLKLGLSEDAALCIRREVSLQRQLATIERAAPGLVLALGWQIDEEPIFIEYPYFEEGDLRQWMLVRGAHAEISQRLALVGQVAATVSELHAAGIVHQQLEPRRFYLRTDSSRAEGWRILVADIGGVSIGKDCSKGTTTLYCAPEVLSGGLPTQHSNLYALGMLLFQMFVGDLSRPLSPGWEDDVSDPLLRDDIRGLAALRPEERSLSAAALANGLRLLPERHAHRAETQASAARQRDVETQLQRQRLWLRQLSMASAALLVGLAVAAWSGYLALEARDQERLRREEAQAVLGFLTDDLLTRADPYQGGARDIGLRGALDAAAARIDERLGTSPETAAAVHEAVSDAYEGWSEYAKAAKHRRRALELLGAAVSSLDLAEQHRQLCHLERRAGRLLPASESCSAAAEIDRARDGFVSAASIVEQAKLDDDRGRCIDAIDALQPIVDGRLAATVPAAVMADAHWFLGRCQSQLADDGNAVEALRAAVRLVEEHYGPSHRKTAWALVDFASALTRAGHFEEGTAVIERLTRMLDPRLGSDHSDVIVLHYRRAQIATAQGRYADAIEAFRLAHEGWGRVLGASHSLTVIAGSKQALAMARNGDVGPAAMLLARMQMEGPAAKAGRGSRVADFHETWAETLLLLGRADAAGVELAAFEAATTGVLQPSHPRLATARCLASWKASLQGDMAIAGSQLALCRQGLARFPPDHHRRRALVRAEQAIVMPARRT